MGKPHMNAAQMSAAIDEVRNTAQAEIETIIRCVTGGRDLTPRERTELVTCILATVVNLSGSFCQAAKLAAERGDAVAARCAEGVVEGMFIMYDLSEVDVVALIKRFIAAGSKQFQYPGARQ